MQPISFLRGYRTEGEWQEDMSILDSELMRESKATKQK